jgi:hypothetical protein
VNNSTTNRKVVCIPLLHIRIVKMTTLRLVSHRDKALEPFFAMARQQIDQATVEELMIKEGIHPLSIYQVPINNTIPIQQQVNENTSSANRKRGGNSNSPLEKEARGEDGTGFVLGMESYHAHHHS